MITNKLYKSATNPYPVGIQVPDSYATSKSLYPVIIWIHGIGGRVLGDRDDGLNYIMDSGGYGEVNYQLQKQIDVRQFILVSPKLTLNNWYDADYGSIQNAYNQVVTNYRADLGRIYLMGHSWGGQGTTGYPASSSLRKVQIQGSITIAGVRPNLSSTQYATLKDYPIWFIHDQGDPQVPYSEGQSVYNSIGGIAKFDTTAAYGHGAIVDYVVNTPKYLDWLLGLSRLPPIPATSTTTTTTIPSKKISKKILITVYNDGTTQTEEI